METKAEMPAYPFVIPTKRNGNGHVIAQDIAHGLTKREHFAAMAMQGLVANPNPGGIKLCCEMAVECADALISALNASSKEAEG